MAINKFKLTAQPLSSHDLHLPYEKRNARETNRGAKYLSQLPKSNKKQISDEELEEARRRGCYKVLPPVLGPHEEEPTMIELLQEIDEQLKNSLILY
jgi:hypothetical protein